MPYIEDGLQSEFPGLAGRHYVYQNDLYWNICSLTRLSFSLSSPLLPLQASHHSTSCSSSPPSSLLPCCKEQPFSWMHLHICLMGHHQGERPAPASSFSLSLSPSFISATGPVLSGSFLLSYISRTQIWSL